MPAMSRFIWSAAIAAGATAASVLAPASASLAQYSVSVLADNPVAYYRLNERSGAAVLNAAASGAGNNAAIDNTPVTQGVLPGAITGDPANAAYGFGGGSLLLPNSVASSLSTSFTLEFWFQTSNANQAVGAGQWYQGAGLVDAEVSGVANDFGTSLSGGRVLFGTGNPDITIGSTSTNLANGTWNMVAATWTSTGANAGLMQLYINGVLEASTTASTAARTVPNLRVARLQTNIGSFFGNIDEVALYSTALSADRIAAHYAAAPVNAAATAPEPSALALLALPLAGMVIRRRQRKA